MQSVLRIPVIANIGNEAEKIDLPEAGREVAVLGTILNGEGDLPQWIAVDWDQVGECRVNLGQVFPAHRTADIHVESNAWHTVHHRRVTSNEHKLDSMLDKALKQVFEVRHGIPGTQSAVSSRS